MGKLGIDSKMVIRATCKKYIDTLPTDQAEAYVEEMRSAVGEAIQQKIDEAETWLTAAETSLLRTPSTLAPRWLFRPCVLTLWRV